MLTRRRAHKGFSVLLIFTGGPLVTLSICSGSHARVRSLPHAAVPPLAASTMSPSLALLANNLSLPTSDLPPGASPRKKPRKQQHVISTEEGDMMETNSTDDEKSTAKSLLVKAEKRKSPPKEYIGNGTCCRVKLSHLNQDQSQSCLHSPISLWLTYWNCTLRIVANPI